jgi:hypothetical protein
MSSSTAREGGVTTLSSNSRGARKEEKFQGRIESTTKLLSKRGGEGRRDKGLANDNIKQHYPPSNAQP